MQQENDLNPFKAATKLYRVEFNTKFKNVSLLDLIFEDSSLATSAYEIESDSVDSKPNDIWKYVIYAEGEDFEIDERANEYIIGNIETYLEDNKDWVSIVQQESKPIIAGKFFVANSNFVHIAPSNLVTVQIDAGRAFGTGEHETTSGCLQMISQLKINPSIILDVGTGTGILAIGAKKLWPNASVIGTDIDPIAISIAKENSAINNAEIKYAEMYEKISLKGKVDLIISNILAKPLIGMTEDFYSMVKPGGFTILSGFIKNQFDQVTKAYLKQSFILKDKIEKDSWHIVLFQKHM